MVALCSLGWPAEDTLQCSNALQIRSLRTISHYVQCCFVFLADVSLIVHNRHSVAAYPQSATHCAATPGATNPSQPIRRNAPALPAVVSLRSGAIVCSPAPARAGLQLVDPRIAVPALTAQGRSSHRRFRSCQAPPFLSRGATPSRLRGWPRAVARSALPADGHTPS